MHDNIVWYVNNVFLINMCDFVMKLFHFLCIETLTITLNGVELTVKHEYQAHLN